MSDKKITDDQIKEYCKLMNYKMISIDRISFEYERPNGERAALLKAAASKTNIEIAKKRKS